MLAVSRQNKKRIVRRALFPRGSLELQMTPDRVDSSGSVAEGMGFKN
jgi:hypothetical protein